MSPESEKLNSDTQETVHQEELSEEELESLVDEIIYYRDDDLSAHLEKIKSLLPEQQTEIAFDLYTLWEHLDGEPEENYPQLFDAAKETGLSDLFMMVHNTPKPQRSKKVREEMKRQWSDFFSEDTEFSYVDTLKLLKYGASLETAPREKLFSKLHEIFEKDRTVKEMNDTARLAGWDWSKVPIHGDELRIMEDEARQWKEILRERLFASKSEKELQLFVDFLQESGADALTRLNTMVSNLTYRFGENTVQPDYYDHRIDNTDEGKGVINNIKVLTSKILQNPDSNYLLSVEAQMFYDRASKGTWEWNKHVGLHDRHFPFEIAPNKYAISVPYMGHQELVISDEGDFGRITALINELESIKPELIKVSKYKGELFAGYRQTDIADWPYEVQAQIGSTTEVELRSDAIEKELNSFFTIERNEGKSSKPISDIDPGKILSADDISRDSALDQNIENKLADDLRFLHTSNLKETLSLDVGLDLSCLTLPEQFNFLAYIKDKSVAEAELIKNFTKLYGVDGMRTFLSLERGDETLGDHIVAFGQYDEVAGQVFKYYGELLNSAEQAEALVREVSDCEGDMCTELGNQVRENIINRAQKDLEKAVRSHDPSEVATQIENYVAAAKEYVALLQEVGNEKIESVPAQELSETDKTAMRALQRANYEKQYQDEQYATFKNAVYESLNMSFSNENTVFNLLRDEDTIVSFNRFDTFRDTRGREITYFGSFNADPAYSGVGGVMLEKTIKARLEDGRAMQAHCDPTQPITQKYIEDGFIATAVIDFHDHTDFEIWRTRNSSEQLVSKGMKVEELVNLEGISDSIIVREQSDQEQYPELQDHMALTRYFSHHGKTYLVFETLPHTLQVEFSQVEQIANAA